MKAALSSIRRRLDAVPLWAVGLLDLGILALWLVDFRLPDPILGLDEIVIGGVLLATGVYTWKRVFGPPSSLAAEKRRRLAEVEILHDEIRKSAGVAGVAGDVARLGGLIDGIKKVEARIEQAELVLALPQYSKEAAASEVTRLKSEVEKASDVSRGNLAAALMEAERHVENIDHVRMTRDELSSAFERIYQIVRRIHSQVIGLGIAQGSRDDLASSVDELARTVDEYEKDRIQQERAEKMVDVEVEEERRRQAEKLKKPTGLH
jgi:hypothetical protein